MLRKQLLGFVVLLVGLGVAEGQNHTVFQENQNIEIPVAFNPNQDANARITNYFIEQIALSNQMKAEYTKYTLTGLQICRIMEIQTCKFSASFELTDLSNKGDITYKSFSISDVLIPSNCSFKFIVYGSDAAPISMQPIAETPLIAGYNKLAVFDFADTSKAKNFRIILSGLTFGYDSLAITRFAQRLKLIDDYYSTDALIDQYLYQVRRIDFSNTDMIIVYDIRLKDLEKTNDKLYETNFPGKLQLGTNDPIKFIEKYNHFSDTLLLMRNQMNEKLAMLDRIYYQKGIAELERKETEKARGYFIRSIVFNPGFAPSQLELAKIQFTRDSLLAASDKIAFILLKLNPEPWVQKQVVLFADTVYNKMLNVGNEFVRTEKFNEAVELFEQCNKFCDNLPGYTCSQTHHQGLAAAKFGIYQSYLTVSQKALDNSKLELAEIYITSAQAYQKANSSEIISDAEALLKFEKLVNAFVLRADTLNGKQQFEKALTLLDKAQNICTSQSLPLNEKFAKSMAKAKNGIYKNLLKRSIKLLKSGDADAAEALLTEATGYQTANATIVNHATTADSLLLKIKSKQYKDAITSGLFCVVLYNYKSALTHFDFAKQLQHQFALKADNHLDSMIRATALPVILKQIDYAKGLVQIYMVDSANAVVPMIENIQSAHQLANDSVVNNRLSQLRKLIFSTTCSRAKTTFDSAYTQASMAANKQNYMTAAELFMAAIKTSEVYAECNLDAAAAIADKKVYQPAADYQQMLQKAEFALAQQNFAEYFVHYYEAETFYAANNIRSYGLTHHLLIDLVSISTNVGFVLAANQLFVAKNLPDEALTCLKTLRKLQYPIDKSKGIQQQAGIKMALKDIAGNAILSPTMMITSYTANEPWFKYFRSAYSKTWKAAMKPK